MTGEHLSQNEFLHELGISPFQKQGPAMDGPAGPGAIQPWPQINWAILFVLKFYMPLYTKYTMYP